MSISTSDEGNWVKIDLHIHTLDDPKDAVDYSAHQLLERARSLGFGVLAITLHDAVFDRKEVFADAATMGILLIPAAEMRLCGAASAAGKFRLHYCAASVLHSWRLNRSASVRRNRVFRCDRALPFSHRSVQSESPRKKSGIPVWETINCDFRRAPAACLWAALHQHPDAACTYRRKCLRGFAQRSVAPNESSLQLRRPSERDLFCLSYAPVPTTAENRRRDEVKRRAGPLTGEGLPSPGRKLRPNRRTQRETT